MCLCIATYIDAHACDLSNIRYTSPPFVTASKGRVTFVKETFSHLVTLSHDTSLCLLVCRLFFLNTSLCHMSRTPHEHKSQTYMSPNFHPRSRNRLKYS